MSGDQPSRWPRSDAFAGRVAVVTGAGMGIGAGIARGLAFHGARVLVVDVDRAAAADTVASVAGDGSPGAEAVVVDVTAPGAGEVLLERADALGGIDVLVNNVGDFRPHGPFLASPPDRWQRMYDLNLRHVFAVSHVLLPGMVARGRGAVINVSSVEGLRGIPGNAVYGAFKAALIAFTASLAAEVGQFGVRVNAIAPDFTETPQLPMHATAQRYPDHVGRWVPVGRFGDPVDHADAVVFLAGPASGFVTGSCLRVDGGTLAAPGWFRRDQDRFTNLPRPLG